MSLLTAAICPEMDFNEKRLTIKIYAAMNMVLLESLSSASNGTKPPTKALDSNVKNAASQTGKQTCFIVLLLQATSNIYYFSEKGKS